MSLHDGIKTQAEVAGAGAPTPAAVPAPVLAPPGAGLPGPELLLGRILFAGLRGLWSREGALRWFSRQARHLGGTLRTLSDEVGSRRVLVPRLMGLEDSSRHWSPFMIAQHLVIVNRDALAIMEALCAGRKPAGEVHMAGLKPDPAANRQAVDAFDKVVADFERRLPGLAGWPGTERHRHPWFGPLTAHGWLCMTAMHHSIHVRQLKRVLEAGRSETEGRRPRF